MSHDEIAHRAYEKWLARCETWDRCLQDWLAAETELALEAAVKGQLARLFAERREAERRLITEHSVSRILTEAETITDAAPKLIQALCECLDWDVGAVWLLDQDAHVLRCLDVWHLPHVEVPIFEQDIRSRTFSQGIGLPGRVWDSESMVWTPDMTGDAGCPRASIAAGEGLRGAIGFPIHNGVEYLGVLEFFCREVRQPDQQLTEMMKSIARHIAQFIERRTAERRSLMEKRDRHIARDIQRGLLPKTMPQLPGFQISGMSSPANLVGGDWFDFISLSVEGRDCLGMVLADASGHGIGAALVAVQTRAYLRSLALTCSDVGLLLDFANVRLAMDLESGHFVTAFIANLDPHTRFLTYASAGHLPGYMLDGDGQTKAVLSNTGLPLGIEPAIKFSAARASLEPGNLLLLVSDGITEAASPAGGRFGMERALHLVRQHRHESPGKILAALFDTLGDFCNHQCLDDMTAVVIKAEGIA